MRLEDNDDILHLCEPKVALFIRVHCAGWSYNSSMAIAISNGLEKTPLQLPYL